MSSSGTPPGKKPSSKVIRPMDRQKMADWLKEKLDQREFPDHLWWEDAERRVFNVRWPHAARQGFNAGQDAKLYKAWAVHTGREGDHKKWKSNFRCAIHSLRDVKEVTPTGKKKGKEAFRVYRFLDEPLEKRGKKGRKQRNNSFQKQESTTSNDSDTIGYTLTPSNNEGTPASTVTSETSEESSSGANNVPNFSSLGIPENYHFFQRGFSCGATFTTVKIEDSSGSMPCSTPIVWRPQRQDPDPITPQLLEDIEEMVEMAEPEIEPEIIHSSTPEEDQVSQVNMEDMIIVGTYHYPATRSRTPSGDSGHPDSPESVLSQAHPGCDMLPEVVELPEGCLLQESGNDEGFIEFCDANESYLLDISEQHVCLQDQEPVHVEEVQTLLKDDEFGLTGLQEELMDTA